MHGLPVILEAREKKMSLTAWNPSTIVSRGHISVGVCPAVVDINAPTVTELSAGLGLDCAITTFVGTSSSDGESVDWLCNLASETLPGSISHEIDDLLIKATGQEDDSLFETLSVGDPIYIWRRDGLEHSTPLEEDQRVWVWRAIITSIDPAEADNTFVGITAHVSVMARTDKPVKIVGGEAA